MRGAVHFWKSAIRASQGNKAMQQDIRIPKLGLTMTEGTLIEWCVSPGEAFTLGQTLFVIESEKAAVEVPAEADGMLLEILAEVGATLPCGTVIARWEGEAIAGAQEAAPAEAKKATPEAGVATAANTGAAAEPATAATAPATSSTPVSGQDKPGQTRIIATPLAKRIAANHHLDLGTIKGSGPAGRIRANDIYAALEVKESRANVQENAQTAQAVNRSGQLRAPTAGERTRAQRLTEAKQQIPHFYLSQEVNANKLCLLREQLNAAQNACRFTFNHFILASVGRALKLMPEANVVWTDEGILDLQGTDVGIAVNTGRGLYAPVLQDAGLLSLSTLAEKSRELIERAQNGKLTAAQMSGGSITVSNAGMHNVTYMTSIINPGQSMILGVGSIRDVFRPDENSQPVAVKEIGLVLSVDHRVHDGVSALRFLKLIVDGLEQPLSLMVQA